MKAFWHAWLPVLLILGFGALVVTWARRRQAERNRPLELRDEELAPWFPYGAHPVVLPQTFLVTPSITPGPPPAVPQNIPVVVA